MDRIVRNIVSHRDIIIVTVLVLKIFLFRYNLDFAKKLRVSVSQVTGVEY